MPPAQHGLGLAQLDELRGGDYRLHTRSAQAIDRERGHFDGHASFQHDVTRAVNGVARSLLRVTENRVLDLAGLDAGAFHGFDRCDRAKFLGREIL